MSQTVLERAGVKVTETSLQISDPDLPYEDFEDLLSFLGSLGKSYSWWVGDSLLAGEGMYGEKIAQAADLLDLSPQTLANRMSICSRIPRSRRRSDVPFSLHAEIAYLPPKEQAEWLKKISSNGWTRSILREHLAPARAQRAQPAIAGSNGQPELESARADSPGVITPAVVELESHLCKCVICGRAHRSDLDVIDE